MTLNKVNHISKYLSACYKQKLKQEAPVTRSIKKLSDEADAKLQDCFSSTAWNMFRDSSDGIEEYATSVTGFINTMMSSTQCLYIHTPTRSHGLQATSALS
jgi:uncharacterized protein YecT (DUF1311 family)